jgi:hypothetical protein
MALKNSRDFIKLLMILKEKLGAASLKASDLRVVDKLISRRNGKRIPHARRTEGSIRVSLMCGSLQQAGLGWGS